MRIAMWSGPRNLSTAMMYSFGNRADMAVVDEPFYAAFLSLSGLIHPMQEQVLASQPTAPAQVISQLLGDIPDGKPHFYQKHMCHHMIDGIDRSWMADVVNVFLIRHPARVIASYDQKRENPTLEDIGYPQQKTLFNYASQFGRQPVVIDSDDILCQPRKALSALCGAIGLQFDESMLSWPKGGHKNDGVWAHHWYNAVHKSTGFVQGVKPLPNVADNQQSLYQQALPLYQELHQLRLQL